MITVKNKIRRALGAARLQLRYPEYIRSNIGRRVDESSCLPATYQNVELTRAEKDEIKALWSPVIPGSLKRSEIFYKMVKGIGDFDARYLPSSFYYPYILFALSPEKYAQFIDNKSLMSFLFPDIPQPRHICSTIGGGYYDEDMRPVSKKEVAKRIIQSDEDLIVKTSIDSERGLGVRLIKSTRLHEFSKSILDDSIFSKHDEFVIQKVVKQSKETSIFNPSSLNCIRVTTLNLNGTVSICSTGLKCGGNQSFVDNIGGGRGGVIVGIQEDGRLCETGYYADGKATQSHNGIEFKNKHISNFSNILKEVTCLADRFPNVRLIGWDIAVSETGSPILIEANAIWPGITLEQFTSGPIFSDRTQEVIDFIRNH